MFTSAASTDHKREGARTPRWQFVAAGNAIALASVWIVWLVFHFSIESVSLARCGMLTVLMVLILTPLFWVMAPRRETSFGFRMLDAAVFGLVLAIATAGLISQ